MTFTASDVLLKAASRIEEEGMWCQGYTFARQPESATYNNWNIFGWASALKGEGIRTAECVEGAVVSTIVEMGANLDLWLDAIHLMRDSLNGAAPYEFNDAPGRTAHEVAEAMRQAALG